MNIEKLRGLWDGHAKAIYGYLLRLTKSEADASDFLQDLFHRLARQPELVERLNDDPRGYLLRLARNAVVDQVRRTNARERVFEKINAARPDQTVNAENPDNQLLRDSLVNAVRHLEKDQQDVVYRRLWKRQTFDDIARELSLSINTVASRYRYGIDKMRAQLRSLYEDFAPGASKTLTTPIPKMKTNPKNPVTSLNVEDPIIQPLEQRRVPSATGAPLGIAALPVPEDVADHSADNVDVTSETEVTDPAIDDQSLDAGLDIGDTGSDVGVDEVIEVDPPVNFDDLGLEKDGAGTLDLGTSDVNWAYDQIFASGITGTLDQSISEGDAGGVLNLDGGFVPVSIHPNIYFALNPGAVADDGTAVDDGTLLADGSTPDDGNAIDNGGFPIMYFGAMGGFNVDDGGTIDLSGNEPTGFDPAVCYGTDFGNLPDLGSGVEDGSLDHEVGTVDDGYDVTALDGSVDHPNIYHALNPGAVLDDGTEAGDGNVFEGGIAIDDHSGDLNLDHGGTIDDGTHTGDLTVDGEHVGVIETFGGPIRYSFGMGTTAAGSGSPDDSVDSHPEWAYRGGSDPSSDGSGDLHPSGESPGVMFDLASMSGAPVGSLSHDVSADSAHVDAQHAGAPGLSTASHETGADSAHLSAQHFDSAATVHPDLSVHADAAGHGFIDVSSVLQPGHFTGSPNGNDATGADAGHSTASHETASVDHQSDASQAASSTGGTHEAHESFQAFDQQHVPALVGSADGHDHEVASLDVTSAHHDVHDFSVESQPIHGTVDHWVPLHEHAAESVQGVESAHYSETSAHDDFIPLDHHTDHQTPVAYTPEASHGVDAAPEAAHVGMGGSPAAMAATGAILLGVEPKRRDKAAQD